MAAWKPKRARVALLCVAAVLALAAALWDRVDDGRLVGTVEYVVDGDTFQFAVRGGDIVNVRLWGIDAPERDESGGPEATDYLRRLTAGRTLACERPPTGQNLDHWGRTVRLCRIDGLDIAADLIAADHAVDVPDYSGGWYETGGEARAHVGAD